MVGIEVYRGKLRIRLPRTVLGITQRYINTSLEDTQDNHKQVQKLAWTIEEDIRIGNLDTTFRRYKTALALPVGTLSILDIWSSYCEHKKHLVSTTTYTQEYQRRLSNHITRLPSYQLGDAKYIQQYLYTTLSVKAAKLVLMYLNAACTWSVDSGLIVHNPFKGLYKSPRGTARSTPDPFSYLEREAILETILARYPRYHPFVKFLFLTGCRTGEAIGLQWQHVSPDSSQITFRDTYNTRYKIRKATKTGITRRFPCNSILRHLLEELRPPNVLPDMLVFPSRTGITINLNDFNKSIWRGTKSRLGIVPKLVSEGLVERYRCLYTTRHTFITMCLDKGIPVTQVALWVGNSPDIILKHYSGIIRDIEVPIE